jgi:hypothetical protein
VPTSLPIAPGLRTIQFLLGKSIGPIPTRGNLFLPVRLLVWADGRGTVEQADSAARTKLQGAPNQKLLQLKKYTEIPLGQAQGDAYFLFRCLP